MKNTFLRIFFSQKKNKKFDYSRIPRDKIFLINVVINLLFSMQ